MTKTELIELLETLGLRPSRKLGQNFLVDSNLLRALVRAASPREGEDILEVGPGTGVLTRELLAAGANVTAVEIDRRLADYLEREFGGDPRFRLVRGDACRTDCAALFEGRSFRCIANLPYSAGTVFIARQAEARAAPDELYVLLQKEVAERLTAVPGTKAYGALTVTVGLRFAAEIVRMVPPSVFFPPPEVDSAYVRLTRRENGPPADILARTAGIARQAFGRRRKKAAGVLAQTFGKDAVAAAFEQIGLPPDVRAERVSPADFVRLASCLADGTDHIDSAQQGG